MKYTLAIARSWQKNNKIPALFLGALLLGAVACGSGGGDGKKAAAEPPIYSQKELDADVKVAVDAEKALEANFGYRLIERTENNQTIYQLDTANIDARIGENPSRDTLKSIREALLGYKSQLDLLISKYRRFRLQETGNIVELIEGSPMTAKAEIAAKVIQKLDEYFAANP